MPRCRNCNEALPFRALLWSPGLSVADVECPHCRAVMHAGPGSKRVIWSGLTAGGCAAAAAAYAVHYGLGWGAVASILVILIIAVVVAVALTGYTWRRDDFQMRD